MNLCAARTFSQGATAASILTAPKQSATGASDGVSTWNPPSTTWVNGGAAAWTSEAKEAENGDAQNSATGPVAALALSYRGEKVMFREIALLMNAPQGLAGPSKKIVSVAIVLDSLFHDITLLLRAPFPRNLPR